MKVTPKATEQPAATGRAQSVAAQLAAARAAQVGWARTGMRDRLRVLRAFRSELATEAVALAATIPVAYAGNLNRTQADSLVAEVLPLAEACRFLEREAEFILRARREGTGSRPLWLRSVDVVVERVPFGVVLLIGPGNYPLLLPGVQALQAIAAGNVVLWKPAPSGMACAHAMRVMLIASGMPAGVLTVLDADPAEATAAIEAGVDKVFLTGSSATGEAVMHVLAKSATPAVMELSGCDAVFVLEGADMGRVVNALVFGMRLNGSATCMAPRRIFVSRAVADTLAVALHAELLNLPTVTTTPRTVALLSECLQDARQRGAQVLLDGTLPAAGATTNAAERTIGATLVADAVAGMRLAQTDLFAPVLSLLPFRTIPMALAMHGECPYALTAAVFGPEKQAREVVGQVTAGTVLINDVIVATADPRVPFGARKRSGFGTTRGREGLLEMTAVRTTILQRSNSALPYQPAGEAHGALFAGYIQVAHAKGWRARLQGLRAIAAAMPGLKKPPNR